MNDLINCGSLFGVMIRMEEGYYSVCKVGEGGGVNVQAKGRRRNGKGMEGNISCCSVFGIIICIRGSG